MTEDDVLTALGHLAAVTTGWNDRAIEEYAHELLELQDAEALMKACQLVGRTWPEARRPSLAEILATYRREAERLQQRRLARSLPANRDCVYPEDGVEIARDAYVKECRLLYREPNHERFDRIMRAITA